MGRPKVNKYRIVTWTCPTCVDELPKEGGTYLVSYMGERAWMYFHTETKRWHPITGWRRKVGYPWSEISAWCTLPSIP